MLEQLAQQGQHYAMTGGYLRNFHSMLWEKRAPAYAVPTAVDVLSTGEYARFPAMDAVCRASVVSWIPARIAFCYHCNCLGLYSASVMCLAGVHVDMI